MRRVTRGRATSLALPADGAASVDWSVTRDFDGSSVGSGTAAPVTAGEWTLDLTAVQLATLDTLTVEWTTDTGDDYQEVVEVAGGHHFGLGLARGIEPFKSYAADYPDEDIIRERAAAEWDLENECGQAFVPRYARARFDGHGLTDLILPFPTLRRVRAVTIDGTALTADELDALTTYREDGVVYRSAGWPAGRQNVEVVFEHGMDTAPGRVPQATLALVRHYIVDSPVDDRAQQVTNEDGVTLSLTVAGRYRNVYAVPEANAVVAQYGVHQGFGSA